MKISEQNKNFFDAVFQVVRLIPPGRVTSYGLIGNYLGSKKSARMVGWAMNASHRASPPVPAHRVVNSIGMLTGKFHFPNLNDMELLLSSEGVEVKNDKVVNFKQLVWNPMEELEQF